MSHRRALLRGLVTSMVLKEQIRTTLPKAKELRPLIEKYVSLGRVDSVHNRRLAASYIFDKEAVKKLFTVLGPRFKNRAGGYTRIIRTDYRKGDAAQMAVIEFVEKSKITKTTKSEGDDTTIEAKTETKDAPKKSTKKAAKPKKEASAAKASSTKEAKPKKTTKKTKKSE